ncbi:MAG: TatD family hydrolase [Candidatus Merdivicinus sp.]|jgi:TatD DNase family protein
MQGNVLYSGIFDSHAHYNDERFDEDREAILASLPDQGVCGIVNCGCNVETSRISLEYAQKYPYIYAAAGFHPEQADEYSEEGMNTIREMLKHPKMVAVGEIGLDYYWPEPNRQIQKDVLEKQLILAKELDLPVIIHSRDAAEDTIQILKKYPGVRGVIHCFSGSAETAKIFLNMGFYIGFTGVLTFANNRRSVEACRIVPLDRLLLETDCPYMAPVPCRGKRCWSPMIAYTAERMAEIKGISVQELLDITRQNSYTLFSIH